MPVDNKAKYISVAVTTEGEQSRAIPGSPPAAPATGCEPGSGAAAMLYLAATFQSSPNNGGINDGNLRINTSTNTIEFVASTTASGVDGTTGTTTCPMISIDGETGYVASATSGSPTTKPTIAKFNLQTQTKLLEAPGVPFNVNDYQYRLLAVRRTDNHVFCLRAVPDSPSAAEPGRLYHLDEDLNLVGFYEETGTETPDGYGAMSPVILNSFGNACAMACGVNRLYVATEPTNLSDGVLVFDITTANPTFVRYVTTPHPTLQPVWNSGTTYVIGDKVSVGNQNYQSVQNGNLNNPPSPLVANWSPTGPAQSAGAWDAGTTYSAGNHVTYGSLDWLSLVNGNLNNLPTTSGVWWNPIDNIQYAIVNINQATRGSLTCDCDDNAYVFVYFGNFALGDSLITHGGLLKIGPSDTTASDITPTSWSDGSTYQWNINYAQNSWINCMTVDLGNKVLVFGGVQTAGSFGGGYAANRYRLSGYRLSDMAELWHIDGINSYWGEVSGNVADGTLMLLDWTDGTTHGASAAVVKKINTLSGAVVSSTPISSFTNWTSTWFADYSLDGAGVTARA